MANSIIRFGEFELDGGRFELRQGDCVLKLEKIPMELLTLLAASGGQLVTREEIAERIWGKNVFLDVEHGVNTAIRKVRRVLRDDPENPKFVQTVTGKGYRFIAPTIATAAVVEPVEQTIPGNGHNGRNGHSIPHVDLVIPASPEGTVPKPSAPAVPVPRTHLWLRRLGLGAAGIFTLAAICIALNLRGLRERFWLRPAQPRIESLAVLPLENLSGDPAQNFFADGMTDELITVLARNTGLRVVSRTSVMQYKGVHRPLPEIARELHADAILEGSVARSEDKVHLNLQLIYAPDDSHLWAESYDRDLKDVAALHNEASAAVAHRLGRGSSSAVSLAKPILPEAYDAYFKGRYYWFLFEHQQAIASFQKAIELQPDYAAAWSGLADAYIVSGFGDTRPDLVLPRGEAAARRGLQLDDSLADVHNTMAAVHFFVHWDLKNAERESLRAIQLNPAEAEPHHLRAKILLALNRDQEGLHEQEISTGIDPFARPWAMPYILLLLHRPDAAAQDAQLRIAAQPNDAGVHAILAEAYRMNRMYKEWAAETAKMLTLYGNPSGAAAIQQAFLSGGYRSALLWNLAELKKKAAKQYVSPTDFMDLYSDLGDRDEALRYLELARRDHAPELVQLQKDWHLDSLRSDPGYRAVVKKMGLP
jgi:TolB-like protein/DNA-binding winged helix-turn-helix (wHTH) protein